MYLAPVVLLGVEVCSGEVLGEERVGARPGAELDSCAAGDAGLGSTVQPWDVQSKGDISGQRLSMSRYQLWTMHQWLIHWNNGDT